MSLWSNCSVPIRPSAKPRSASTPHEKRAHPGPQGQRSRRKAHGAQAKLKDCKPSPPSLDLTFRSRDAQIDKSHQTAASPRTTRNIKLPHRDQHAEKSIEEIEEDAMKVLEDLEASMKETSELTTVVDSERTKLAQMKSQMSESDRDHCRPNRFAQAPPEPPRRCFRPRAAKCSTSRRASRR